MSTAKSSRSTMSPTPSASKGADAAVHEGKAAKIDRSRGSNGKSSTPRLTLVNGRKVYTSAAEPLRITRDQIERAVASLKK